MAHSATVDSANKQLVFFMPYVHWEDGMGYDNMLDAVNSSFGPNPKDQSDQFEVLRTSLQGLTPQHVRRTLDQSYYSSLEDTSQRDKDQVVQRYARDILNIEADQRPMLMVDQCWLWIIGGDTILTAFPRRWDALDQSNAVKDPSDILSGLYSFLKVERNRDKIKNVEELAYLIIDRCASSVLDIASFTNPDLQFLRFFEESIDGLMVDQATSLKKLWKDVENSETVLIDDSMFKMTKDFRTLEKIKDILEELTMLTRVIRHQSNALNLLSRETVRPLQRRTLDYASSHGGSHSPNPNTRMHLAQTITIQLPNGRGPSHSGHSHATSDPTPGLRENSGIAAIQHKAILPETLQDLLDRAQERDAELSRLTEKAEYTYNALHGLLDLKQRQANLSEAQSARRSAHEMEAQSNSIMLFTVVTILFLPLSSLASIFGMNAAEFGQGKVTLTRIFSYLFPISAFVVVLTFLLAFNHNLRKMLLLWIEIAGTTLFRWFPTAKANAYVKSLKEKLEEMHKQKSEKQADEIEARQKAKKEAELRALHRTAGAQDDNDDSKGGGRQRLADEESLDFGL